MKHLIAVVSCAFLFALWSCDPDTIDHNSTETTQEILTDTETITYEFDGQDYTISFDAMTLALDSESQAVLDGLETLTDGLDIQTIRKASNPSKVYLHTPESAVDAFGFNPFDIDYDNLPSQDANSSASSRTQYDALRFYEHINFGGENFSGTRSWWSRNDGCGERVYNRTNLTLLPMAGGGNWNDEISSWIVQAWELPNLNAQECDDYVFLFLFLDVIPGASYANCQSDIWLIDMFNVAQSDLTKRRWCPWPFGPGNMNDDISSFFLQHLPRGCAPSHLSYGSDLDWDNVPCRIFKG